MKFNLSLSLRSAVFVILFTIVPQKVSSQQSIGFGVHADPLVGWFSSNNSDISGKGARPGFNFGLTFNKYFYGNYAFSTGLSLITAGGSFSSSSDTVKLELKKPIDPGSKIVYKINSLAIPIGIKLRTNQIGYISIFADIGLDPKFILGGKVEAPSQNIAKENADNMLNRLSMGYHIIGGIEYSLGGSTAIVLGINFDNNFTDITKQPNAKITHKMLGFHLGLNF